MVVSHVRQESYLSARVSMNLEVLRCDFQILQPELAPFSRRHNNPSIVSVIQKFNLQHPINKGMQNSQFLMSGTAVVEPPERKDDRIVTTPLMQTGPGAWEETQPPQLRTRPSRGKHERQGDLPLAVAVKAELDERAGRKRDHARLVVWGSTQALSNINVITAGVPFGTPGATNILRIAWVE